MPEPHIVTPENAAKFDEWIRTRGGLAIWRSVNLSNPGTSWITPAKNADGTPVTKPTWEAANEPERIITDAADVLVSKDVEVKRFHVGIRLGGQGLSYKVTDGGSRRIRSAVAKAGEGAYHLFDYSSQEAVIFKPESQIPLFEFLRSAR